MNNDGSNPAIDSLLKTLMQKIISEVYELAQDSNAVTVNDRVQFEDDLRGRAYQLEKFMRQNLETFAGTQGGPRGRPPMMPRPRVGGAPPSPTAAAPSVAPATPSAPAPVAEAEAPPPKSAQGGASQRHKFLLRLMAGKFANLYSGHRAYLPREVIGGFDSYLQRLMGLSKYEELNEHAQQLLEKIPHRDDDKIWQMIMANEGFRMFAFNILIRILLKFEDFEWAKRNFMSIVNNVTEEAKFVFEDRHFKLLFVTLFAEVFEAIANEEEMERINEVFGTKTAYKIKEIHKSFKALVS